MRRFAIFSAILFLAGFGKAETVPKLDFDKVDPRRMLIDPYSYWSQPYSFYFFHHMDRIPHQHLNWVRKPSRGFALKDPQQPFSLSYTINGTTSTLDQYLEQADVLGIC